jgi:hypothetical protein
LGTLRPAFTAWHDVLIPLSALSIGAVVITQNDRDCATIQKIGRLSFRSLVVIEDGDGDRAIGV